MIFVTRGAARQDPPRRSKKYAPPMRRTILRKNRIFGTMNGKIKFDGASNNGVANVRIVRKKMHRRRNVCRR